MATRLFTGLAVMEHQLYYYQPRTSSCDLVSSEADLSLSTSTPALRGPLQAAQNVQVSVMASLKPNTRFNILFLRSLS